MSPHLFPAEVPGDLSSFPQVTQLVRVQPDLEQDSIAPEPGSLTLKLLSRGFWCPNHSQSRSQNLTVWPYLERKGVEEETRLRGPAPFPVLYIQSVLILTTAL